MTTLEFVLLGLQKRLYLKKVWLLCLFGTIMPDGTNDVYNSVGLSFIDGKLHCTLGEEPVPITDYKPNSPLCDIKLNFIVPAGTLKCIKKDVKTTYGILVLNALILEYPFDGEVEYQNKELNGKLFNKLAFEHLVKTKNVNPQHIKYENAAIQTMALSQVSIPSLTRKSITPNPAVAKAKAELLEKYKDSLYDPAVISLIQSELTNKVDAEYLKGDDASGFYITGKQKNVVRLRSYGMVGAEPDINDETKLTVMTRSLNEGWTIEDLPTLINSSRRGSINRSNETALAGVDVKNTSRIIQNYDITEDDCGTTVGQRTRITKDTYGLFVGNYIVGESTPLTIDKLQSLIGKWVYIRSPSKCRTLGSSLCKKCMGDTVSDSGIGLTAQANTLTSTFMGIFMALVHTTALSTSEYSIEDRIT